MAIPPPSLVPPQEENNGSIPDSMSKKLTKTVTPSDSALLPLPPVDPHVLGELIPTVEDRVAVGTIEILSSLHISEGPGRIANAPVPSVFRDDRGTIHRLRIGGKRVNMLFSKQHVMRSGYVHPTVQHDFVISGKVEVWVLTAIGTEKKVYGDDSPNGKCFTIPPYVPHLLHFLSDAIVVEWWEKGLSESSSTSSTESTASSNSLGSSSHGSNDSNGKLKDGKRQLQRPTHVRRASVAKRETNCWYYHPYRHVVDVQNTMLSRSAGRHQLLVPQDETYMDPLQKEEDDDDNNGSRRRRILSNYGDGKASFSKLWWWTIGVVTGTLVGIALGGPKIGSNNNRRT